MQRLSSWYHCLCGFTFTADEKTHSCGLINTAVNQIGSKTPLGGIRSDGCAVIGAFNGQTRKTQYLLWEYCPGFGYRYSKCMRKCTKGRETRNTTRFAEAGVSALFRWELWLMERFLSFNPDQTARLQMYYKCGGLVPNRTTTWLKSSKKVVSFFRFWLITLFKPKGCLVLARTRGQRQFGDHKTAASIAGIKKQLQVNWPVPPKGDKDVWTLGTKWNDCLVHNVSSFVFLCSRSMACQKMDISGFSWGANQIYLLALLP